MAENRRRSLPPQAGTGFYETLSIMNSGDAPWWMLSQSRTVGSIYRMNLLIPGVHTIVVADAHVARQLLQGQPQVKPRLVYSGFNRVLGGQNIATLNGLAWKHARKGTVPAFVRPAIESMGSVTERRLNEWLDQKLANKVASFAFDVAKEMVTLTTTSIAESALEYEMSTPQVSDFQEDLEIVLKEYLRHQVGNPLRLLFGWFIPSVCRANRAAQNLRALTKCMLDHYYQSKFEGPTSHTSVSVINCIAQNPCYRSDTERCSDILTFLVAGHDTTAYSIAWTLIELARHPEEQSKLRQALQGGQGQSAPFLQHVIKESLRLHPVAAMGSVRTATKELKIPKSPYCIPKGSTVFLHLLSIQRNSEYVENPDSFVPSRWETPNERLQQAFLPFALGSRNCIGQGLAMRNVTQVIAQLLLRDLEFSLEEQGSVDHFLTLRPLGTILRARRL